MRVLIRSATVRRKPRSQAAKAQAWHAAEQEYQARLAHRPPLDVPGPSAPVAKGQQNFRGGHK